MTKRYNPYRKPFPRWYHLSRYDKNLVHPLERAAKEPYFKSKNPSGYHHDLGAMDVIFDNFGVLVEEQFSDYDLRRQYIAELPKLAFFWWQAAKTQITPKRPYWGVNFNATHRDANAGEPRSLLRFFADDDLSILNTELLNTPRYPSGTASPKFRDSIFEQGQFLLPFFVDDVFFQDNTGLTDYQDWDDVGLFRDGSNQLESGNFRVTPPEDVPFAGGVILPEGFPKYVDKLRILHPRHCTPDLPLRVGFDKKDFELYERLCRDQGALGTCTSFAVCVALDLLAKRCSAPRNLQFSPSWVHCMSGNNGATGRSLSSVIGAIKHRLPCHEKEFSYDPVNLKEWRSDGTSWERPSMASSSHELTEKLGRPDIRKLNVTDISAIKTHLAAGWLVIVSTSLTEEFWQHGIINNPYGLTFSPLKGHKRIPEGHAWLLTGYDHVDGNRNWKYQGRFVALNAWNIHRTLGKGIVTLPFAMLLTEGIEAYALRLKHK